MHSIGMERVCGGINLSCVKNTFHWVHIRTMKDSSGESYENVVVDFLTVKTFSV